MFTNNQTNSLQTDRQTDKPTKVNTLPPSSVKVINIINDNNNNSIAAETAVIYNCHSDYNACYIIKAGSRLSSFLEQSARGIERRAPSLSLDCFKKGLKSHLFALV